VTLLRVADDGAHRRSLGEQLAGGRARRHGR